MGKGDIKMKFTVDIEKIANSLDFDLEDVQMLMEVFLEGAQENMQELKIAIDTKSMDGIRRAAHAIKGSAANLTLMNIADIAKDIEENAKKSNTSDYAKKYEELKTLVENISV